MATFNKIEDLLGHINVLLDKKAKHLELKRTNAYFLILLNGRKVIKSGLTMAKTQVILEGMLEGVKIALARKTTVKENKNQ